MTVENIGETLLGAVAVAGVHVGGHYLAAEILGIEIKQEGSREIIQHPNEHSKGDLAWFARGGFVLEMGVGTALVHLWPESYFTRGYVSMSCAHILLYPLSYEDKGDFGFLDNYEWPLYLGWSVYNLYSLNAHLDWD